MLQFMGSQRVRHDLEKKNNNQTFKQSKKERVQTHGGEGIQRKQRLCKENKMKKQNNQYCPWRGDRGKDITPIKQKQNASQKEKLVKEQKQSFRKLNK